MVAPWHRRPGLDQTTGGMVWVQIKFVGKCSLNKGAARCILLLCYLKNSVHCRNYIKFGLGILMALCACLGQTRHTILTPVIIF
ncbi:MAG: hypothetical protein FKGGLIKP_00806 [Sodalis sp. Fse]|nr:MAG: hypothetical protein FKGGLIKP_00806 [Sodalis sp. Fse]